MTGTKRNIAYDILRFASMVLVVMIHANVSFLGQNQGSASWFAVMLITALCTLSVPLFFMLSGALLLQKEENLKDLYCKRIPKQAIPFALWSVIYVIARVVMGKIPLSFTAFFSLLWEPAYYQFWFIYTLLGIYLILPLLQILVRNLTKKMLEYALLLWAVFAVLIPTVSYIVPEFRISGHVDLILSEGYVGYFLLGHYLQKYGKEISVKKSLLMVLTGAVLVLLSAGAEWCLSKDGAYGGYFYQSYLTPFVVLGASGVFLLLQNAAWNVGEKTEKVITLLSQNALGIYYVHMLILTALEYTVMKGNTLLHLVAKILLTIVLSFVVSVVLTKIPCVNTALCGVKKKPFNRG